MKKIYTILLLLMFLAPSYSYAICFPNHWSLGTPSDWHCAGGTPAQNSSSERFMNAPKPTEIKVRKAPKPVVPLISPAVQLEIDSQNQKILDLEKEINNLKSTIEENKIIQKPDPIAEPQLKINSKKNPEEVMEESAPTKIEIVTAKPNIVQQSQKPRFWIQILNWMKFR